MTTTEKPQVLAASKAADAVPSKENAAKFRARLPQLLADGYRPYRVDLYTTSNTEGILKGGDFYWALNADAAAGAARRAYGKVFTGTVWEAKSDDCWTPA